jgi:flagellar protein FlbD
MIRLTRLNNQALVLNSDLVKFIEQAPDTVITLISGEKFIVKETSEEVVQRVLDFRRLVLEGIFPVWGKDSTVRPRAERETNAAAERRVEG